MAPLLFKDMKRMSFSCSSPASSTICHSVVRSGTTGRALDRHTPHVRDPHRASFSSKPPTPKSKSKEQQKQQQQYKCSSSSSSSSNKTSTERHVSALISPADSSRFLLNSSRLQPDEPASFITIYPEPIPQKADVFYDIVPVPTPVEAETSKASAKAEDQPVVSRSCSTRTHDQVVVLRVSLHCKGCAGKVKKHISKMEGVTSFDIDLATKKVTVVGDVTPLGVLSSISKVKSAQFWSTPPRASASF